MSAAALDPRELDPRELAALLDWYVENGVDIALDDAAHDRYADSARAPADVARAHEAPIALQKDSPEPRPVAERPQQIRAPRRDIAPVAPDEATRAAQEQAASAQNLEELAERLAAFEHAPFRDMARHFLFAAGAGVDAPLMILDASPGEEEEASGEPFCGAQARLLDNMLAAIGFDRSRARLAYLSPWRPPGRTTLTPPQIAILAPFAQRHVALARPRMLLTFGEASMRAVLPTKEPMNRLRGKLLEAPCGAHVAPTFVFQGLDAMLNSAGLKPSAWRDLRVVARHLAPG
jgi:DNA polymerase